MLYQIGDGQIRIGNINGIGSKLSIKPGNYLLKQDLNYEYYLVETSAFRLPEKIYGDTSITNRWLTSYKHNSNKNLGILLSGLKGAGKTILAQKLCVESQKPVIIITEAFHGPNFIEFISNPVFEDCIIFIDEFEKIYPEASMTTDLLSLFDGNLTTRLIFLVTVNDVNQVSDFMINRPSRLKYRKHYDSLSMDIVDDVIKDLLVNKDEAEGLIQELLKIGIITFDILITIIKDMNLFKENAKSVIKHLNLKRESMTYKIKEIFKDEEMECGDSFCNPFDDNHLNVYAKRNNELRKMIQSDGNIMFGTPFINEEQRKEIHAKLLANGKITTNELDYVIQYSEYNLNMYVNSVNGEDDSEITMMSDGTIKVVTDQYSGVRTFIYTPAYTKIHVF
jgi:hypothetical protein